MSDRIGAGGQGEATGQDDKAQRGPPRPPSPPHEPEATKGNRYPHKPNWVEKGNFVLAALALIAAGAAAYEADRLVRETHTMAKDARQAAADAEAAGVISEFNTRRALAIASAANEQQSDAATAQQRIAEASNNISSATANRQLRAYLYVRPHDMQDFAVDKTTKWGVGYNILGQTPAYDVQGSEILVDLPYPNMPDITKIFHPPRVKENKAVLFPNDPWGADVGETCVNADGNPIKNCLMSKEEFALLSADPPIQKLYLLGVVTYSDAFGQTHRTPFCYTYNVHPLTTNQFEICPRYYEKPD